MSDNSIIVESYLKGSVSSFIKKGMKSKLNFVPSINGDFESEVILLSDDSERHGVSGASLLHEAPYMDSLDTLFSTKSADVDKIFEDYDDVEVGYEKLVVEYLIVVREPLTDEVTSEVPIDHVVNLSLNFSPLMRTSPTPHPLTSSIHISHIHHAILLQQTT